MTERDQAEGRVIVKDTYFRRAHIDQEVGGRFAKAGVVAREEPSVDYPKLPSGPWADPVQVPDEPELGFSVHDIGPTGGQLRSKRVCRRCLRLR